ncbi:MAG: hypothetical protein EOP04_27250 [Proteobacteria bacterium]|nr:MAG: hypothetical protein EOP04_27250 [Pseudomonadota bacterium]
MNKSICHLLITLISTFASASAPAAGTLDSTVNRGLEFLKRDQFSSKSGHYAAGEWRVEMKSYLIPSMVGLGRQLARPSQEPTAFATASVMNLLSEAYLLDSSLNSIPQMLQNGVPSFQAYQEGGVFFYYPMTDFKGMKLHVPMDPNYVPRSMMSLALVPPDADTTAVGFTALAFADQIIKNRPVSEFKVSEETLNTLERYRDLNRDPHPYNRFNGGVKNSGAYMTWLWDENSESSSFFKSIVRKSFLKQQKKKSRFCFSFGFL